MRAHNDPHEIVKTAYTAAAQRQCCCGGKKQWNRENLADLAVPQAELGLSCGNPVAFSHLKAGDVVLDLGSGAGKDVFLAAPIVGPAGKAIGVDMTPAMLALARRNAVEFFAATGLTNVEFHEGTIEQLPVEDASIDVVISNCVINLSPDKPRVFREVHRVLKPGGRMVVSDIVLNRPLPQRLKDDPDLYAGCIAGALLRGDYLQGIRDAGFGNVSILTDTTYNASVPRTDPITSNIAEELAQVAASITVMAVKEIQ